MGKQLVRAADSIGSFIAEGDRRGSYQDNRRFSRVARGSLNETKHFLRRANCRGLLNTAGVASLKPLLDQLGPMLNAFLTSVETVPATAKLLQSRNHPLVHKPEHKDHTRLTIAN